jgi:hypothetical protein
MTLLIADSTSVTSKVPNFGVFEQLTNYGALGIVVLALGAAAWFFIKKNVEEKERMQKMIDQLNEELRRK